MTLRTVLGHHVAEELGEVMGGAEGVGVIVAEDAAAPLQCVLVYAAGAEGAKGSLDFYWAVNGSGTWNPEQVAPPGTVG